MNTAEQIALEAIQLQLEPIAREVAKAETRLAELNQSKAKLEAAIKALTETKTKMKSKPRKPSKPFAKKETVMKVCLAIVQDNDPIAKSDLQELAKDKIGNDLGYNLSGVQLRLQECLASEAFAIDENEMVSISVEHLSNSSESLKLRRKTNEPRLGNGSIAD